MSAHRPPAGWPYAVTELVAARPELEGVGISYAATVAVSA